MPHKHKGYKSPRRWMLVTSEERDIIEFHRRQLQRIEKAKARRRKVRPGDPSVAFMVKKKEIFNENPTL